MVLDSTGYCCRPPGPLLPLHATVPGAVAAAAGGGRRRSARQEQSTCRSSRENCLHEASGQACCQSARAIRNAGPCGQSARCSARTRSPKPARDPHADKQTIAFNGARYGGLHKFHQISFGYGQTILLYAQSRKREQYRVFRRSS